MNYYILNDFINIFRVEKFIEIEGDYLLFWVEELRRNSDYELVEDILMINWNGFKLIVKMVIKFFDYILLVCDIF